MKGTPGMWSLIVIMGVIIFGLYLGIFTPSEAAGVSVFVVLLLSLIRRKIRWEGFRRALEETGLTACMVFFIIIGIQVFNLFLALTGAHMALVPRILEILEENGQDKVKVFLGGIIPDEDVPKLKDLGVAGIYEPGTSTEDIVRDIRAVVLGEES